MKGWIAAQGDAQGLRLWRMRGAQVQDRRTAPPGDLDATLTATGWPVLPVIRCGTGAALRPVPAPAALHLTREPGPAPVWIVSGLSQADPTAQMSDTAVIAGLIAASPGFDGVICQPGATTT
ncbi:MAG: hypothetical protein Q4G49_17225, partial [Paracoccus sp. (in: a-proteobacteria)]|nr:hypothetical protein [Paracoccus sp. (in: a-proteobacteria)]